MGQLTITTFVTLDGVMQAPGGPGEDPSGGFRHEGWLVPHFDADMGGIMDEIFRHADAFLLGRRTYDIFAAHWPRVPEDPGDIIRTKLNALPKHVASRTRSIFDWHASQGVRDVTAEVPALKERYAGELQVHGSGNLAQTLLAHDLIDVYRLLIFPVVVGTTGKRLFSDGTRPASLQLAESRTTGSGVIHAVYRRGGALGTGSFRLE